MDFRDHQEFVIDEWKGIYRRADSNTPLDHFTDAVQVEPREGGVGTRRGFVQAVDTTTGQVSQFQEFVRSTGTQRFIWYDENTRKLYDTGSATPTVAIDTAPVGTTGFSLLCLYDRAYIAYHNYSTGITSTNLKVYYEYPAGSGTWVFRDALGSAPAVGTMTAVNSATAGVIEAGTHLFKVAYETDTGFITPASGAISYIATGGFACDLTNIPTGPSYVVARHILVTKAIATYSGNPQEYEFFFLTRIADNTTTELSTAFPPVINFYDSQLTSSADYLYDLISSVKSPMGMCMYGGRVVYWGFPLVSYTAPDGTTVNLEYGTFFVSNVNDPETISLAENINKVSAADGGSRSIYCMAEYRGSLYIFKRGKTYATRDDGVNVPSAWPIELVDAGFGCEALFGVARVESGQLGVHEETLFVANYNGLYAFQGSWAIKPLSWKIEFFWRDISETYFKLIKVAIQPTEQRVYVLFPGNGYNAGSPSAATCYTCIYKDGITWDNVQWYQIDMNYVSGFYAPSCIQTESVLSNGGNSAGLLMSFYETSLASPQGWWRLTQNAGVDDVASAIYASVLGGSQSTQNDAALVSPTGEIYHLTGQRVLYYASGTGTVSAEVDTYYPPAGVSVNIYTINTVIGYRIHTQLLNSPCAHFGYSFLSNNIAYIIQRVVLFFNPLWPEIPL